MDYALGLPLGIVCCRVYRWCVPVYISTCKWYTKIHIFLYTKKSRFSRFFFWVSRKKKVVKKNRENRVFFMYRKKD